MKILNDNEISVIGCRPFTVSPESGLLAVGANMQITVEYQSLVVGTHCTDMVLHYNTGQHPPSFISVTN